jgi:signal transduction histidine kinase
VEESDVNATVERTLALLENQSLFQNVRITRDLCTSPPKVSMDIGQIQQVFTNIILNAAEAMQGKGDLTVATRVNPDEGYIEVEFTDTGCGIAFEDRERIFEPFFTTKEVGRGTGLGLSISHGIIARHKGTIEVKSEPGKGTTFIVKLPLRRKEN